MTDDLNKVNKEIVETTIENEKMKDEALKNAENLSEQEQNQEINTNSEEKNQTLENLDDNTDKKAVDDKPDVVKQAKEINKQLKAELDELRSRTSNVFEENENLKKELEEQKKLDGLAKENAEIKAQLEAIKRGTLIDGMIATGRINDKLKGWAESLTFEQLEEFSKHAPKVKTILDIKNDSINDTDADMQKWKEEMEKSRIIS